MIDHKNKFIHVPIPKTASQALAGALGFVIKDEPALYHATLEHLVSQHYSEHINYYKFSIVRNPWDKLTSLWRDFKNHRGAQYSAQHRNDEGLLSEFGTFENLCLNLKDSLWSQNLFFKPQVYFLSYAGKLKMDYVGRFENLNQSYIDICVALGKDPQELEVINHTISPNREEKYYRSWYNDRTMQAAGDLYKLDIEEFGYDF